MNWELVLQIIILAIVILGVLMLAWAMWDTTQRNKHERNLETLKASHDAWQTHHGQGVREK